MTPLRPAGPDRRFSAFALDRALVWTVDGLVVALVWWWLGRSHPAVAVFLAVVVAALLWLVLGVVAGLTGRSPGKALLGLRLVRADDGGPLGVGRALLRALVLTLATLPTFGIGAAVLAWTATADATGRRRGWHDLVTGSVVVDLRPVAAPATPVAAPPPPIVNLTTLRLMPVESAVEEPTLPALPVVPRPPAGVRAERPPISAAAARPTTLLPRWRLVFDTGEALLVEGLGLLGRNPEPRSGEEVRHLVPLRSQDLSLSKTHAQFHVVDGTLVVMDRGSTNGSVLIRQGVSRELSGGRPATLLEGDRVRFGDREMTVLRES